MSMYNLVEYSGNYSKKSESLRRYIRDEPSQDLIMSKPLLQELNSDFKRTINWNKYQSTVAIHKQNQYLDYLIDPSFQGVNRFFLSFKDHAHQKRPNKANRIFFSESGNKRLQCYDPSKKLF